MAEGRSRAHVGLTRQDVVDGALALIDEVGLDGFSVRALAKRMGVYPAALHWHAGSRTELLALVVTEVARSVPVPETATWEEFVRELAAGFRRTLQAHPAVAPAFVTQVVNATPELPAVDRLLAHLEDAGFHGAELREVYNAVIGAAVGFVGVELAAVPADDHDDWATRFATGLDQVDGSTYPALARNLPELRNRAFMTRWESGRTRPMDAAWETLLDLLVAGLRARLAATG
ncbi:MAG TPA: TetR/AcrR family transcriptional regulator C-terminal domain-containing protein [Pseudonocardia sp.]|nr:TetR/AcrR family transcriptional regulator C-terminal domain-containing protein [Pseudonocardia sp.]